MELRLAICEDNINELEHIDSLLNESHFTILCDTFETGEDFLKEFYPDKYDLIFMDIYMNGITGVETVTKIRAIDDFVPIAFTTSSLDFTLEGYRLNVFKYIEKPVTAKALEEALRLAEIYKQNVPSFLYHYDGKDYSIAFTRIMYIEQKGRYLNIYMTGESIQTIPGKLDSLESQFPIPPFCRCHKSFLINFSYVKYLDKNLLIFEMTNGQNAYISRGVFTTVSKAYENYLFDSTRRFGNEK